MTSTLLPRLFRRRRRSTLAIVGAFVVFTIYLLGFCDVEAYYRNQRYPGLSKKEVDRLGMKTRRMKIHNDGGGGGSGAR